jgi:hypothetical protein
MFIPRTDSGVEAIVSSGHVMLEIGDAGGTNMVRRQLRVTVETLVKTLLPDGKLGNIRKTVEPDQPTCAAGRHRKMSQQ